MGGFDYQWQERLKQLPNLSVLRIGNLYVRRPQEYGGIRAVANNGCLHSRLDCLWPVHRLLVLRNTNNSDHKLWRRGL